MTTPRTAAGQALLADLTMGYEATPDDVVMPAVKEGLARDIAAIEAEAMPTEAEMAAALPCDENDCDQSRHFEAARAILAAIRSLRGHADQDQRNEGRSADIDDAVQQAIADPIDGFDAWRQMQEGEADDRPV